MQIEKDKNYEIIVFPNQDIGLKAQQILVTKDIDFKHISTLAVVVPEEKRQDICRLLNEEGVLISGYYPFLYRDYEEEFFKKAKEYKPSKAQGEFLKSITLCNAPTLTFTKGRRMINLYNIKIAIAKADDIIDAWNILNELKELINKTYQNRDKIKPNYEEKVKITALQIYGWLPKSNCKACGEATCLAFAVKLLQGEQKLENCRPLLTESGFSENKIIMQEMIEALGL